MPDRPAAPLVGVVVLTQGARPEELRHAVASVLAQEGVDLDLVVVGNGTAPDGLAALGLPDRVRRLELADNLGIPAGRHQGALAVAGKWLLFVDDDAALAGPGFLTDALDRFRADPTIGLLQPRVVDPTGAAAPRRWIPRLRKGDPARPSVMFSCWEGVVVLPREVYDRTGGWGAPYFYAHEGIELAWRVWDTGRRAWYAGDLVAHHPVIAPTRHADFFHLTARNRVWLARRNLPLPFGVVYVAAWVGVQALRTLRRPTREARAGWRAYVGGIRAGLREPPGGRRPLRWSTIARMTRAGRPPLI